jgi:predicted secreted hydrolase
MVGGVAVAATGWQGAEPGYSWQFPRDHWARAGYRTEWWYLTGHLATADARRRFGYQFTFFRIGLLPEVPDSASAWGAANLIMGHAAISDLGATRHVFSELLYRAGPFLGGFGRYPEARIAWSRAPAGTDALWTLHWNGEAFDVAMADRARGIALRLTTRPAKPLVFQGPGGYSRKGEGPTAASHYYSFTRLRTEGWLTVSGRPVRVRGKSWMDKEFGSNQLAPNQVGWDWFGLQLDDGRELMLYVLRDRSGASDAVRATLVSASGTARHLGPDEWTVRATQTWQSPRTGAEYPSRWVVEVPGAGLRLEVVPEFPDQENRSQLVRDLFYWEGAVSVRGLGGDTLGRGYVELTGYGTNTRPAI